MFKVNGNTITLSRGDTGAIKVTANAKIIGTQETYIFGPDDRALFTMKGNGGQIVKQRAYQMTDNVFIVIFSNHDTDSFPSGSYSWDVRYVINPYYDGNGNIISGDQVITPNLPMAAKLENVVGDI